MFTLHKAIITPNFDVQNDYTTYSPLSCKNKRPKMGFLLESVKIHFVDKIEKNSITDKPLRQHNVAPFLY